jgi:hypothetical protein
MLRLAAIVKSNCGSFGFGRYAACAQDDRCCGGERLLKATAGLSTALRAVRATSLKMTSFVGSKVREKQLRGLRLRPLCGLRSG